MWNENPNFYYEVSNFHLFLLLSLSDRNNVESQEGEFLHDTLPPVDYNGFAPIWCLCNLLL